jgi:hypothetical protein
MGTTKTRLSLWVWLATHRGVLFLALILLGALFLGALGCSRYFGDGANSRFWQNVRPASGEVERHLRNAHYYQMLGRTDVALKELEEAHQADPANLKVVNNLARTYEEIGELDRAQQLYQEALVQDSANPALNNNLCYSYYLAGKWDQAESCFRQALARDPQNLAARNNLGLLLCRNGRVAEARQLWQEAEGAAAAENKLNQVLAALGQTPPMIASSQKRQAAASPPPIAAKAQPSSAIDLAARPAGPLTPTPVTPAAAQTEKSASPVAPVQTQVVRSPAVVPVPPTSRAPKPEPPQLTAVTPVPGQPLTPPLTEKMTRPEPASQPRPEKKPVPMVAAATGPQLNQVSHAPRAVAVNKTSPAAGEVAVPVATASPRPALTEARPAAGAEESPPVIRPRAPAPLRPQALASRCPVRGERTHQAAGARPEKAKHPAAQAAPAARPPARVAAKPPAPRIAKASAAPPARSAAQPRRRPPLTVEELVGTGIEVLNGNGTPNLARRTRLLLSLEGFRVDSIGNWRDFGVDETLIYYRPGALRVAEAVNGKFFHASQLQESTKLSEGVDVKVVLGHDLTGRADLEQKLAAAARPVKETRAAPVTAQIMAWATLPETPPKPGLTAQELSQTSIEIKNGNGTPQIARETRSLLSQEGFQVARIGNHLDFGVEKTVICYRPEAQRVAQALNARFFHSQRATTSAKLPKGIDIKVVLGQDLRHLPGQMAKLAP